MNMDQATAERWVTISAFVVIAIYGYRRLAGPPAQQGTLKNVLGQGNPVPLGQFVTAWGVTFFVVAIMAEASPSLGGSFAILIAAADLLNNMGGLVSAVTSHEPKTTTTGTTGTTSTTTTTASAVTAPTLTVGVAPLSSITRPAGVSAG